VYPRLLPARAKPNMFGSYRPIPAAPGFGQGEVLPEIRASSVYPSHQVVFPGSSTMFQAVLETRVPMAHASPQCRILKAIGEGGYVLGGVIHSSPLIPSSNLDLWEFPRNFESSLITDEVEASFFKQCSPEQRSQLLRSKGQDTPSLVGSMDEDLEKGSQSDGRKPRGQRETKNPKYDLTLAKALHQTFFYRWWLAGLLKLGSGESSPVVSS
jgi:hypothetical protein